MRVVLAAHRGIDDAGMSLGHQDRYQGRSAATKCSSTANSNKAGEDELGVAHSMPRPKRLVNHGIHNKGPLTRIQKPRRKKPGE